MAENKNGNNGEVKIVEEKGKLTKVKDFFNPKKIEEKHPVAVARSKRLALAVGCFVAGAVGDHLFNKYGRRITGTDVIDTDDYYIEDTTGVDTTDEAAND